VRDCANSILKRNYTDLKLPPPEVSKIWAYRFFQRLPAEYKRTKQKLIDPKRIESEDVAAIQDWYDRLEIIYRYNLQALDIYNSDEVGFMEG